MEGSCVLVTSSNRVTSGPQVVCDFQNLSVLGFDVVLECAMSEVNLTGPMMLAWGDVALMMESPKIGWLHAWRAG